ncbi:F5/8_type C domain-containing protein [Hexamita inflata]|uniref:F5/8 type C domain-containing protein n=1 Tax=Hexamita inflata TaxID=28002 RepID=A0AA86NQX3_9EUKA|nr:F5/8 type C domain-containing protein [Hexamita inflata]
MKVLRMSYRVGATRTSSACRTKYNASQSYLDSPNGWVSSHPKDQDKNQEVFIQTQFKSITNIKKLTVKCQYESTTIKVQSSNNGIDFADVRSFDIQSSKLNQFNLNIKAKAIRIIPTQFDIAIKFDFLVEIDPKLENFFIDQKLQLSKELSNVTRNVSDCYCGNESGYGACQSYLDGPICWCPDYQQSVRGQYLEFDFHRKVFIAQIITQGRDRCNWVTKYKVKYESNGEWHEAGDFKGNSDQSTKVARNIRVIASKLRIYPLAFNDYIDLRADVVVSEDLNQINIVQSDEQMKQFVIQQQQRQDDSSSQEEQRPQFPFRYQQPVRQNYQPFVQNYQRRYFQLPVVQIDLPLKQDDDFEDTDEEIYEIMDSSDSQNFDENEVYEIIDSSESNKDDNSDGWM